MSDACGAIREGMSGGTDEPLDLLVIGGGVMGLFTAYHASAGAARGAVLENGEVGDPQTTPYGHNRSSRKKYLDPISARMVH
ncbi:MAG: FAD-dependent oxidoreductase, partial [Jatrophihabitans sp.]